MRLDCTPAIQVVGLATPGRTGWWVGKSQGQTTWDPDHRRGAPDRSIVQGAGGRRTRPLGAGGLVRAKAALSAPQHPAAGLTVNASRWMRPEQQQQSSSRTSRRPQSEGLPRASPLLSLTAISGASASPDTASDAPPRSRPPASQSQRSEGRTRAC